MQKFWEVLSTLFSAKEILIDEQPLQSKSMHRKILTKWANGTAIQDPMLHTCHKAIFMALSKAI